MVGVHVEKERAHNSNKRECKEVKNGRRTKRKIADRKKLSRKIPDKNSLNRRIWCQIKKSILLVIWVFFTILAIRKIAYKIVDSITLMGEDFCENAVLNENDASKEREGKNLEAVEEDEEEYTKRTEKMKAQSIYNQNPQLLVLVNKDRILEDEFNVELTSICQGRLQASAWLYSDLVQMLSDANKAGHSYWIASAYRSRQRQQQLVDEDVNDLMQKGMTYEQALKETYEETMPAGYSEHETGLALDILCANNTKMDVSQEKEDANIWLQEHCHEYGFILRYPKDKVDITKINYEPWHFRYVGKDAAKFMKEHDMVLEEFYDMLEEN